MNPADALQRSDSQSLGQQDTPLFTREDCDLLEERTPLELDFLMEQAARMWD